MKLLARITENRVWRSVVRHGVRPTNRNRSMVVMESLVLHLHPAKVRRRSLEFSNTYFLGAIAIWLGERDIRVRTVAEYQGERPWSSRRNRGRK